MPELISDFILVEESVPAPLRIDLHIPRSGKLPEDHLYFEKGIKWFFIREADIAKAEEPGFYDNEIPPAQEIHVSLLEKIAGIPLPAMCRKLNERNRFATGLPAATGDLLLMMEYFVHEHIRAAPKREGEGLRGIYIAAFRFAGERWQPIAGLWQQRDLGNQARMITHPYPQTGLRYQSGILRWF